MVKADRQSTDTAWESVVRVVYPVQDADQTMPLYAIDWTAPSPSETTLDSRIDMRALDFSSMNQTQVERLIRRGAAGGAKGHVGTGSFTVLSRDGLMVKAGNRTSLCTYFNAFPAAYWRRWTKVNTVRFSAQVTGQGRIFVYRSSGRGLLYPAGVIPVDSVSGTQVHAEISMTGFMDGGYMWFDAEASTDKPLTVSHAVWQVPADARTAGDRTTMSVAIATFNRPTYCLSQLQAISGAKELRTRLDTVYCTDQGTDRVENQPGFAAVAQELGEQLTYIKQPNLGGSGGFSRGMYEAVKAGRSDYVLLLDDDAISEPESIVRALQFSDYTVRPVLVGGGMLHLDNRTILYTQGERINMGRMWMQPSQGLGYNHDFSVEPLRDAPDRHQRIDEDFNGWWMCLIPVRVIRAIGLSLPIFIKFDDIEYGLRAKRAGFPTVCLPGVGVWHQAWHDKDDARTWSEYFTNRNRWIAALVTGAPVSAKHVIIENMYSTASLGLRFIYSGMALHNMALRDVLRGPEYIKNSLPVKLAEVRKVREVFPDAQAKESFEDFPEPDHEVISPRYRPQTRSQRRKSTITMLTRSIFGHRNAAKASHPDTAISAQDTAWTWLAFAGIDSALVTAPGGDAVAWFKRDDKRFRKELLATYRLSSQLARNWKRLSAQYQAANLASIDTWEGIFDAC